MNQLNMGLENIVAGNGPTIAIMGMLIVFAALTIIATFIAQLPRVLPLLSKIFPEKHQHAEPAPGKSGDHDKVLAAIAYALFHKDVGSLPAK